MTSLKERSPEERARVARLGGIATSKNKEHMREIGRRGGLKISNNREHMAKIGQKGGKAPRRIEHGKTKKED